MTLRDALQAKSKDTEKADYSLISDGVDRYGALEWVMRARRADGIFRFVAAYEAPAADDGTTQFEIRGYICDENGRYSDFVTRTGSLPDDDVMPALVADVYETVEAMTAAHLQPPATS
ncbi:hypothetical protein ACH4Q7_22825 [Streptomyces roseolus]|uniref:hypothetical protein n=1 Tax=Streptomyces roseolus TaxID=67358 RepID=UPI0037A21897